MSCSRRKFVQCTLAGGAVAASGLPLAGCGNGVPPAALAAPALVVTTPGDPRFGTIAVAANGYEELVAIGGAITVPITVPSTGMLPFTPPSAILLIHRSADAPQFVAFESACPHAGCPLGYASEHQLVACPCHSSRFFVVADPATGKCPGDVEHAPARASLKSYAVTVEGQQIYIDLHDGGDTGATLEVKVADHPELMSPGGSTVIYASGCGASDPVIVIRKDATTVLALDARCTHAGCEVAFNRASDDIECPCHGSAFDLTGAVTHAPATLPLKKYGVSFDGTRIVIHRG
jgi:Rieske Fe-S protein